jgi:hypothetical protein
MLRPFNPGSGRVEARPDGFRLHIGPASGYSDAQLDDTRGRPRRGLLHRPPSRLTLEARASAAAPGGTLGFGFWNDPFPSWAGEAGAGRLLPASPQALWFFYASPPSHIPFSPDGPPDGWAAAAYRGPALPGVALTAAAAAGAVGMLISPLRAALLRAHWRWFEGRQSAPLTGLESWHGYGVDWQDDHATFTVDGRVVLEASLRVAGPLGIVIWIDNQWASLSMDVGLRAGVLPSLPESWLDVRAVELNGSPVEVAMASPTIATD